MLDFLLSLHLDLPGENSACSNPATGKACLTTGLPARWFQWRLCSYRSPLYPQYRVGYLHLGCLLADICGAGEATQAIKDLLRKHEDQSSDSQDLRKSQA